MWTLYKTVAPFPETLRFIGRDKIINDDTRGIMNEAFRRSPSHGPALWPGVTFDIGSEEALALLGTPNGGATAYILADRAASLGKRRLNVRIWVQETNPAAGYQMLWDMAPPVQGHQLPPSLAPLPPFEPISLRKRGDEKVGTMPMTMSAAMPMQTV